MFGHHKAKRAKKKLKREQESFNQEKQNWEEGSPERMKERDEQNKSYVNQKTEEAAADREKSYAKGRERAENLFKSDIQGLDPEERNALQYEANRQIKRNFESQNRKLLGEQSRHGITGQGGVGYAQQRDLMKQSNEAYGQAHRDLDKLNSDLRLKKIASIFASEQGEAAQSQLDKQLALDELKLDEERRKQKYYEDQRNREFSRV